MYFDRLSSLVLQCSAWLQSQVPLSSTSVTAAVSRNDFQWDQVGFILPCIVDLADSGSDHTFQALHMAQMLRRLQMCSSSGTHGLAGWLSRGQQDG